MQQNHLLGSLQHTSHPQSTAMNQNRKKSKPRKKRTTSIDQGGLASKRITSNSSEETNFLPKSASIIMNIHTTNNYYGNTTTNQNFFPGQKSEKKFTTDASKNPNTEKVMLRVDSEGREVKLFDVDMESQENSWDD